MSCSPSLDSQSRIDLAEKISSDLNIAFCALGDMFFFFFSTSESKNKPITSTSSHTNIRNSVSENAIRTVRMSKHSSCQSMESDLCVDGMRVSKRRGLGFPGSPCVSTSYRGRHGSKEVRMPHRRTPPPLQDRNNHEYDRAGRSARSLVPDGCYQKKPQRLSAFAVGPKSSIKLHQEG